MKNAKKYISFGSHDRRSISNGCWKLFGWQKLGMLRWKLIFSLLKKNKIMIWEHWWDFCSSPNWNVRREEVCSLGSEPKHILEGQSLTNYWSWLCKKILRLEKLAFSGSISLTQGHFLVRPRKIQIEIVKVVALPALQKMLMLLQKS